MARRSGIPAHAAVALWNLAPSSRVLGAYTGLYAVTWYLGGFGGPALIGAVVDLTGWTGMLLDIAVLAALAVLVLAHLGRLQRRHPKELDADPADHHGLPRARG